MSGLSSPDNDRCEICSLFNNYFCIDVLGKRIHLRCFTCCSCNEMFQKGDLATYWRNRFYCTRCFEHTQKKLKGGQKRESRKETVQTVVDEDTDSILTERFVRAKSLFSQGLEPAQALLYQQVQRELRKSLNDRAAPQIHFDTILSAGHPPPRDSNESDGPSSRLGPEIRSRIEALKAVLPRLEENQSQEKPKQILVKFPLRKSIGNSSTIAGLSAIIAVCVSLFCAQLKYGNVLKILTNPNELFPK